MLTVLLNRRAGDRPSLVRDQAIPNYGLWGHRTTRACPSPKPVGAVCNRAPGPSHDEGLSLALQGRRQLPLHRSAGACLPRCRGVARDRPSPYETGGGSRFTVARGPVLRVAVAWRGTGPRPTGQAAVHASPYRGGLSPASIARRGTDPRLTGPETAPASP